MRYTALALDYDGTIAHDGGVPAHVLEGLVALKASGRKLLLVTGRELNELLGIFPEIGIFDRVVAENGALLYRPATQERHELGEPPPRMLVDALRASGIPLAAGHTILATVRPHETVVLECIARLGLEQQVIFNKGAVMVLPPGCNKASGLRYALAELGMSPRNVVAGGDGENDHAMLELAEYSVATANGIATLKDAADYVTHATHGEGILEVVRGLIESDLASLPPKRRRRPLCLGDDATGEKVILPSRRASILVVGGGEAGLLALTLLERLGKSGYQFCGLDTRGDYTEFHPAVIFGTLDSPPAPEELLTALEKPDIQAMACIAAVPAEDRVGFATKMLASLRHLRATTGRPHWIFVDEALDVVPASSGEQLREGAENTIFVSEDPAALAPELLAAVDGIVACGDTAGALLRAIAKAAGWEAPALPPRNPHANEALVWLRKAERPIALLQIARREAAPISPQTRSSSDEVGNVLRRA